MNSKKNSIKLPVMLVMTMLMTVSEPFATVASSQNRGAKQENKNMQEATEITVVSSIDASPEKSLFYFPVGKKNVPLVVGLHTWSAERSNQLQVLLPLCKKRGWALLLPEFRGPNLVKNPRAKEACASRLAKQDISDALDLVLKQYPIDEKRVFLIGGSGGGHMALMMAADAPTRFRAISSWCPITDLAAWHGQNAGYAPGIEACCGGKPGASPEIDREYRERSPLFQVVSMTNANLSVRHGRFDKSVPYSHTVNLALELERLGAKNFFFEIFDGAHDMHHDVAFQWFDRLVKPDIKAEKELTR
ncbi:MAG: prolyl oligopeptidase family serine peptidase [Kiritimatiellia bacterium]|nr:prolyl oligopeptidase family serine peptidase [Kiritimatiellia bacterium]